MKCQPLFSEKKKEEKKENIINWPSAEFARRALKGYHWSGAMGDCLHTFNPLYTE